MRTLIFTAAMLATSAAMAGQNVSFVPEVPTTLVIPSPCIETTWVWFDEIGVKTNEQCVNRLEGRITQEQSDIDAVLKSAMSRAFAEESKIKTPYKTSK